MDKKIETICVQGGYEPGNGEPRQLPIIQSTTFKYDTSEHMAKLSRRTAIFTAVCKTRRSTW